MTDITHAIAELRVAADVCELDENQTVVRQAVRIRASRDSLASTIEALSERIAVLEGALEPIVAKFHNVANSTGVTGITLVGIPVADLRKADASLTPDLSQ